METKHTPTPFSFSGSDDYIMARSERHGQSTSRVWIAEILRHDYGQADRICPDEVQDANKEFIVRACNAHDALLAELKHLVGDDLSSDTAAARRAIADAEGNTPE